MKKDIFISTGVVESIISKLRNRRSHLIISVLLLLLVVIIYFLSYRYNGEIYYTINSDGEAIVTYKGSSWTEYEDEYSGKVIIPSTVNYVNENGVTVNLKVVAIGPEAFAGCDDLDEVVISSNIERIGEDAFKGCDDLDCLVFEGDIPYIIDCVIPSDVKIKVPNKYFERYKAWFPKKEVILMKP